MPDELISSTTWSASRVQINADEKAAMASDFVRHYFLVPPGPGNPEGVRETVASIIVNQGTTPTRVVEAALEWIKAQRGRYFLTWYTPGSLVPTILKKFRGDDRTRDAAAKLFLFPGEVDPEIESVSGPDAEDFAEKLQRHFTYAILSAHRFDVATGSVYFHLPREVRLQRACARLYAAQKFLFLDSSKFRTEGDRGYGIVDLLETSSSVTIYTVSSDQNGSGLVSEFEALALGLLRQPPEDVKPRDLKTLQLKIVGRGEQQTLLRSWKGILPSRPGGATVDSFRPTALPHTR
jgi:hypothetical protein